MSIQNESYGQLSDGRSVDRYTLTHAGITCSIITYGGIITELHVPDRNGNHADVVLGLSSLADYEKGHPYLGAITGRVAGRINGGKFDLEGTSYQLPLSQPPNHLHGGFVGLDKRVWEASTSETEAGEPVLTLQYTSPDGEEGYPGTVDITVTYSITSDAALKIDYRATSDKATPLSITNHSYFNLEGEGSETIADHELQILAEKMVLGDEKGTLESKTTLVANTPHDFREPRLLADFIAPPCLYHGENYLFRDDDIESPEWGATLSAPKSGRKMEVLTTTTGVQLYTGKFLHEAELTGKSGKAYVAHSAVCLECQGFPNGVNTPEIDDIILRPGETYRQTTLYRFSTC
jgi:aldose 1-epimerase